METKDARRTRKLGLLIDATDGGLEAVAIASQTNPAYPKQIVKGVLLPMKRDGTRSARALGDAAAEAIEDAYHLGRGWFDSPQGLPGKDRVARETDPKYDLGNWPTLESQYRRLKPESQELVRSLILQLLDAQRPAEKYTGPEKRSAAR